MSTLQIHIYELFAHISVSNDTLTTECVCANDTFAHYTLHTS